MYVFKSQSEKGTENQDDKGKKRAIGVYDTYASVINTNIHTHTYRHFYVRVVKKLPAKKENKCQ